MTNTARSPRSPLRGRYLVTNPGWNAALRLTDAVLTRVAQAKRGAATAAPKRILIAVGGQIGDAMIATSVLPVLAAAFPASEIGMLVPSWAAEVVRDHPRLTWVHHADHWKLSRAAQSGAAKWRSYRASAANAVSSIRGVGYDVGIDLYAYYPNAAWLLWRSGIPMRVGYTSGGCGPLYTHAVEWNAALGHTAEQHLRLLRELVDVDPTSLPEYELPPHSVQARKAAAAQVGGRYVVVHPGTGDAKKAWPTSSWSALLDRLEARGDRIVLTGAGDAERALADALARGRTGVLNLVGALDWQTFRVVVANAAAAIGPDSAAMHVAAAESTPAVVIMAAVSDPEYWRPLGARVAVLTHGVPCAPCFLKEGCASMSCVRDVSVDEVVRALDELAAGAAAHA